MLIKLKKHKLTGAGFTFIEIIVVIGLIAVLAVVVIAVINPVRYFAQQRNYTRISHLSSMINAVQRRMLDNQGDLHGKFIVDGAIYSCPSIEKEKIYHITTTTIHHGESSIDLSCLVPYIKGIISMPDQLPIDPDTPGAYWESKEYYDTKYTIMMNKNGSIKMTARGVEYKSSEYNDKDIEIER